MRADWHFGPAFNSEEDIRSGEGFLGTDYTQGVDTRFRDTVLGPLLTEVDCSGADAAGGGSVGTPSTTRSMTTSGTINAPEKLVIARGTKLAAIRLDTLAQIFDGSMEGAGAPYGENVLQVIYTKSGDADEQITVTFDDTIMRIIEDIPETGGFTASANGESMKFRYIFQGLSDAAATSYVALGRADGTVNNKVKMNVLSGSTDMDASAFQEIGTISGDDILPTGGAMLGRFPIVTSDQNVYLVDQDANKFHPIIEGLAKDPDGNQGFGASMLNMFGGSVFVPLERSILRIPIGGLRHSVGPETFSGNTSPVRGRWGRPAQTDRWVYYPVYNVENTESYIVAVRPPERGDFPQNEVQYFPIAYSDGKESKVCHNTGKKGSQARNLIWTGLASNVGYFAEGLQDQFPDDTGYTYASSGTLYGTRLRRGGMKHVTGVSMQTRGCSSTETIAVDLVYTDFRGVEKTVRCGAPVGQNGPVTLQVPQGRIEAIDFYPKLSFSRGGTSTNSPKLVHSTLTVEWS
jgi:hypothetical protein